MKKLLLITIAFFSLNATAQEKKVISKHNQVEAQAKIKTKKLTQLLDLSTDQADKVYIVMLQHFKEEQQKKQNIKKMIASKEKTDKAKIKKAYSQQKQEYSEKLNNQLEKILTPEQYKNYVETNLKEQKSKKKMISNKN
jgi:hypothetical protein